MTEEQTAILTAIGDALRSQPMTWNGIPSDMKETVIGLMNPGPRGFEPDQRTFLNWWWMEVDDAKLATLNSKMPPHNVISPRLDAEGNKYISADLFTDAVLPGSRLSAILPDMLDLVLVYRPEDTWPVEETDE
jgi:hypothetical protein